MTNFYNEWQPNKRLRVCTHSVRDQLLGNNISTIPMYNCFADKSKAFSCDQRFFRSTLAWFICGNLKKHISNLNQIYTLHFLYIYKFLIEKFCGIEISLYLKNVKNIRKLNVNSIIVMNHRTRLDWLFYFCVLYRINGLSSIKVILKQGLRKIPGPGKSFLLKKIFK